MSAGICGLAQLPKPGRNHGGAEPARGSRHDLALGPAICTGTEPPLPAGTADDKPVVAGRRNVLRVAGKWTYLYRAVDSTGATIDFLLSARRDAAAAKRFFQKALRSPGHPRPRVINVDGNPSYPKVISELKRTGELGRRCRCRPVRYLNNIVEQDHRAVKRRVRASQGFRAFHSACANDSGYRDGEHDPQGTGEVVGEGRHRWAGRVRQRPLRPRRHGVIAGS